MELILNFLMIGILLIFNAFYILGLFKAAQGEYILSKPNNLLSKLLLGWNCKIKIINFLRLSLYEMLIGCVDCMASFHSIVFLKTIGFYFGYQFEYSLKLFFLWILYVCMLSFVVDFFDMLKTLIGTIIVRKS